jgi:hypothetical protein
MPTLPVVSFANDILPLFRPMDIECMRGRGVFLADYAYMSAKDPNGKLLNAAKVLAYLTGDSPPRMPYGGPYWSAESIQLFQSWMDGGAQA